MGFHVFSTFVKSREVPAVALRVLRRRLDLCHVAGAQRLFAAPFHVPSCTCSRFFVPAEMNNGRDDEAELRALEGMALRSCSWTLLTVCPVCSFTERTLAVLTCTLSGLLRWCLDVYHWLWFLPVSPIFRHVSCRMWLWAPHLLLLCLFSLKRVCIAASIASARCCSSPRCLRAVLCSVNRPLPG